ncbi:MAG: class A beta-lactamase, subclass A2 [Bacteroidetes bacterium]|nr:class A beta-lactamase, subclass A2 [Bacteroidota bacterium]
MKKVLLLLLLSSSIFAQNQSLEQQISDFLKDKKATVGVAVNFENGKEEVYINPDKRLPMQSTFKFMIGLKVMEQVEKGKLSLSQIINIPKTTMQTDLYSPIKDKYPNGASLKLSEILKYTVASSDNVGCDLLLDLIGGPMEVERFVKKMGISDIAIVHNEKVMQSNWENQFQNWSTARAMNQIFINTFDKKSKPVLSKKSLDYLYEIMVKTETGQKRIKGLLPKNIVVSHKTGTSGTQNGISAATNDFGIIVLPSGKRIYITVMVSDSKENTETNELIIAKIARMAFDHFNK